MAPSELLSDSTQMHLRKRWAIAFLSCLTRLLGSIYFCSIYFCSIYFCGVYCCGVYCCGEELKPISFRSDIAPILLDHCLACHGAKLAEGGYRVDSYQELLKAGDSGETPVISTAEAGAPPASELLRRLTCDASERMPADTEPLAAEQIEQIKQWIVAGAIFDGDDVAQSLHLVIPPPTYPDAPKTYPHALPIAACRFSTDGTQIIAGGYHELTLWNVADNSLVRRIGNLGQRVFSLDFSTDGQTLAVACGEPGKSGEVRLINFATGQLSGVVARGADVPFDVAFRPGVGNELAVAMADSTIRIVDIDSQKELRVIASHADWVTALAWSDDGTRLASASRDKSSKIFDGATGELLVTYSGHGAAVRGVAFSQDGAHVLSAGGDKHIHRWQVADGNRVTAIALGAEPAKIVRIGHRLLVPCSDHRLLQIDLNDNKISQTYSGNTDWVLTAQAHINPTQTGDTDGAASVVPSGYVLSSSYDGQLRLWNMDDGTLLRSWLATP